MQKTGLTLPQAMKRLRKADDSVRDAIGEDIEPRLRELLGIRRASRRLYTIGHLLGAASHARRLVEHELDVAVQLQERRRQLRRDRAVDHRRSMQRAFDFPVATSTIRRACRIVAIPIDSASRGTLLGVPAEQRGVAAPRLGLQHHAVRPRPSARAGSLKPMWPLVPMPSICRSIPPAAAIAVSYRAHSAVGIRRRAVEKVDPLRRAGSRARTGAAP